MEASPEKNLNVSLVDVYLVNLSLALSSHQYFSILKYPFRQ